MSILQHSREARHPLGTARIAQLSLNSCQILRDTSPETQQALITLQEQQALLVFPTTDSLPLSAIDANQTRPLLFIDGTWRKAKRLLLESSVLGSMQKVHLEPSESSNYRIRTSKIAGALSTAEAIVAALEYLEDKPGGYQPILDSMDWMIEQQIKQKGEETFRRNYVP